MYTSCVLFYINGLLCAGADEEVCYTESPRCEENACFDRCKKDCIYRSSRPPFCIRWSIHSSRSSAIMYSKTLHLCMHAKELGYLVLPLPAQMLSAAERLATSSKCWAIKSRALACTDTHVRARTHTGMLQCGTSLIVANCFSCTKQSMYMYICDTHTYYTCNEISRYYLCIIRIHITYSISQESHNLNFRCVCLYIDTVINIGDERTERYN
jgi:hypothetical protein